MTIWKHLTLLLAISNGGALVAQTLARNDFLNRYCLTCHSTALKAGGLTLESLDPHRTDLQPAIWERVVRKVRAGEMPPAGLPRPDPDASAAFTAGLIKDLDNYGEVHPNPGKQVVRRLNRTEYGNTIRDLLALDLQVGSELPADGLAAGFDNIADALSMSPLLLERYMRVARKTAELAVGSSEAAAVTNEFPATKTQAVWQGEEMPFGTRGGVSVRHYFPHDGQYSLRAILNSGPGDTMSPTDNVRSFQTKVHVTAGAHVFVATFPDEFAAREGPIPNLAGPGGRALGGPLDAMGSAIRPTIDFRLDGKRIKLFEIHAPTPAETISYSTGPPTLRKVEISGPYDATGVSETPSRKRIFICRPTRQPEERECASKILSTIARRAFRRDLSAADVQPLLATYTRTRQKHGFDESIAAGLADVLVSPDFLFRLELDPVDAISGSIRLVNDFELASRLSFFLWSSIPDDELLDMAHRGKLKDRAIFHDQVRRMLSDSRAETLAANFATQWLGLRAVAEARPDSRTYPEFDTALGEAFQEETRLFVRSVIRKNRSVLDLINGDYTFLNERLARVYGVPGIVGPGFRRVSLAGNEQRGGLLGHGSILMVTSHNNKTSPVIRGKWILDNLLNSPPPPPPPGVPPLDESVANGRQLTTRQQVERHRSNTACASCHVRMDPLGFALENFDVIGRWRTRDAGAEIDPAGKLPGGEELSGPKGLRQYLIEQKEQFVSATVGRLMMYALGRELEAEDQPVVRKVMGNAEAGGFKFGDLMMGIVDSVPFQMRKTQEQ